MRYVCERDFLKTTTFNRKLPMGEIDYSKKENCSNGEDYALLMQHVICEEPELLFLDTLLSECFAKAVN